MADSNTSRRILITGANRGIGLGVVRQLLEDGHSVVATARRPASAESLQSLAGDFPDRLCIEELDVSDGASVDGLASRITSMGGLDALINNAGVNLSDDETFETLDVAAVQETFSTNVLGPIRMTRALLPLLEAARHPVVMNISSGLASLTLCDGRLLGYRLSKAALNMFTRTFAADYPGITCVSVDPGWVQTDMGGPDASLTVEASAGGIAGVLASLSPKDSGRFLTHLGEEQPW